MDFHRVVASELKAMYPAAFSNSGLPNSSGNSQVRLTTKKAEKVYVRDLLRLDGVEFVNKCYQKLLRRQPDEGGFLSSLDGLRTGQRTKLELIQFLSESTEGQRAGVQLKGLQSAMWKAKLRKFFLVKVARIGRRKARSIPADTRPRLRTSKPKTTLDYSVRELIELDEQSFVALCYQTLLGREADSEGLKSQLEELRQGRIDPLGIIDGMLASTEYHDRRATFQDTEQSHFEQLHREIRFLAMFLEMRSATRQMRSLSSRIEAIEHEPIRDHEVDNDFDFNSEQQLKSRANEAVDFSEYYLAFENRFRGSRKEIKERQRVYLPLLELLRSSVGDLPILDVACGRGEWLESLREEGFTARGIDINESSLKICRELDLKVENCDAFQCLERIENDTLLAVTSFHFIEHLPLPEMLRLIDEIKRVLVPGGKVILETPNPSNILVGSHNFYLDPTHRNPLPPALMQFTLEQRGFVEVEIKNLQLASQQALFQGFTGAEVLNRLIYGHQDYAMVGTKR